MRGFVYVQGAIALAQACVCCSLSCSFISAQLSFPTMVETGAWQIQHVIRSCEDPVPELRLKECGGHWYKAGATAAGGLRAIWNAKKITGLHVYLQDRPCVTFKYMAHAKREDGILLNRREGTDHVEWALCKPVRRLNVCCSAQLKTDGRFVVTSMLNGHSSMREMSGEETMKSVIQEFIDDIPLEFTKVEMHHAVLTDITNARISTRLTVNSLARRTEHYMDQSPQDPQEKKEVHGKAEGGKRTCRKPAQKKKGSTGGKGATLKRPVGKRSSLKRPAAKR